MFKFLSNHAVSVKASSIQMELDKVLVQFYRFPDTNSIVAHASIDGFELAIASSPCVDPRNFAAAIGEHRSRMKVMKNAEDKLWELRGLELLSRIQEHKGTDEEFMKKYGGIYTYRTIEESPVYQAAKIEPFCPDIGHIYELSSDMKEVSITTADGVGYYVFDRISLKEVIDKRRGPEPNFNIREYVEKYLREGKMN